MILKALEDTSAELKKIPDSIAASVSSIKSNPQVPGILPIQVLKVPKSPKKMVIISSYFGKNLWCKRWVTIKYTTQQT